MMPTVVVPDAYVPAYAYMITNGDAICAYDFRITVHPINLIDYIHSLLHVQVCKRNIQYRFLMFLFVFSNVK